ncbi:MAG: DUF5658 family protein [Planctomycetota bacterium]
MVPVHPLKTPPPAASRAARSDRRDRPTPPISRYWLRGRRRGGRRTGERRDLYIDRYRAADWALVLTILVLSVCDLVFTLYHLATGGEEANPVMAWVLRGGERAFASVKLGTTVLGLAVLLVHARFRRVRALLVVAALLYAAVLVYHIVLRFWA